jgi:hypothetical protein
MMKSEEKTTGVPGLKKLLHTAKVIRFAVGISLALLPAGPAFAQVYGGGGGVGMGTGSTGTATPSYGSSGKAIGIGVGAAAGGAGSVTGCVQSGEDGLIILDDKKKTYLLMPGGADVVPGERVELRGKKSPAGATAQSFQAKKLVKNLGSCGTPSASVGDHSPSASAMSAHDSPQP